MHTHDCVGHVDGLQEMAMGGDHIWVDTNASGDFCYVGEADCLVSARCARDSAVTFIDCRISCNERKTKKCT